MKKRVAFANNYNNLDWSQVIFTDEATFQLMSTPNKAWTQPGERRIGIKVKHPYKVHVWGCFSAQGFGKLFLFTQNLDATFMTEIYKKALLPYYKV
jgi:hypothetical protein